MSPNDNATPEDASPDDHPTPETTPSAQSATPTDNPESTPEKPSEESPDLTPPAASGSESAESSDATESSDASREELARMVEETGDPTPEVKIGDRLRGKIVSIDDENTFVDYAGRAEARIATSELRDKNQQVVMRVGDSISATVSAVDDGVVLTLGRRRGVVHAAKLRVAFENKVPVQGSVKASNKGGFDVQIGGIRTFCPLSQIDRTYVEDPKAYIGKSFTFRVLRWENGGRNIVVTRRALLEEEAAEKAVETRKTLAVDAVLEGMVTRIQPFGAFIDIGGLEGLLHVSRMSYGRVEDPRKVVDVGQKISVRVLSIENEGTRKERISLGLADLGPDPWETLTGEHKEGDVVSGKVARLTDFGAFVQLAEGVDGLVHISEIANQRIQHPQEVLKVGDEVEVRILRIESEKRRVSLSIRQVSEEQPARPRREPRAPRRQESSPPSSGALTHTMADQLGALKKKLRDQ
jgi:small subunit ribosomal protein S1